MKSVYDAILIVAFGGPEGKEEVLPFMENVLRGRPVPRARMVEVAEHYYLFDGVSPHNAQIRELMAALKVELATHGPDLPIYWGNRNWNPLLPDTLQQMKADGIQHALALFTSPYDSYSSCRQYWENIAEAQAVVGEGAPKVDKIRAFFNHPTFIEANAAVTQAALAEIPAGTEAHLVFTAHSLPLSMANSCDYVRQLQEACRLTAAAVAHPQWELVYQSRSGAPHHPWLEPDICDYLEQVADEGKRDVVLVPIGFLSDHMEVIYDLDTEAQQTAADRGINLIRAQTVGVHPHFVRALRELITERVSGATDRPYLGKLGPGHDVCAADCCQLPPRPSGRPQ